LAFHSGREADRSPPSSAEVKEWVGGARLEGSTGQLH
jgi:hypothetical protein